MTGSGIRVGLGGRAWYRDSSIRVTGSGIRVTGSGVKVTGSGMMVGLGDMEW